jgi:hypothetical protein
MAEHDTLLLLEDRDHQTSGENGHDHKEQKEQGDLRIEEEVRTDVVSEMTTSMVAALGSGQEEQLEEEEEEEGATAHKQKKKREEEGVMVRKQEGENEENEVRKQINVESMIATRIGKQAVVEVSTEANALEGEEAAATTAATSVASAATSAANSVVTPSDWQRTIDLLVAVGYPPASSPWAVPLSELCPELVLGATPFRISLLQWLILRYFSGKCLLAESVLM